jgi:hypothetical protein
MGEGGARRDSVILLHPIRWVDKRRFVRLGAVALDTIDRVNRALPISLGLVAV